MSTLALNPTGPAVQRRWPLVRLFAAGLFVVLVGVGLAAGSSPAQAVFGVDSCTFLPDRTGNAAVPSASGPAVIAADKINPAAPSTRIDPASATVFELLRGQGQAWSTYGRKVDGSAGCNILDQVQSDLASALLGVNDAIVGTSILVYASATDADGVLATLFSKATPLATELYTSLFTPMWPVILIGIGIWMTFITVGNGHRLREGLSSVAWNLTIGALVSGLLGFGWYATVVTEADAGTAQLQSALTSAVLSASGSTTGACALPGGSADAGRRQMACQMWYSLSFTAWATGQYGAQGLEPFPYSGTDHTEGRASDDARFQQLWNQSYSINDMVSLKDSLAGGGGSSLSTSKSDAWGEFAERAQKAADGSDGTASEKAAWSQAYAGWRGEGAGGRFTSALNGIGGALISSLAITVTSLTSLVWQTVPVLLLLALPLVALLGMIPKLHKVFTGWGGLLATGYIARVMLMVILALVLVLFQRILEMNMAPPVTGLFQLVIALGTWMIYRMVKRDARPSDGGLTSHARQATSQTTRVTQGASQAVTGRSGGGRSGLGALAAAGATAGLARRAMSSSAAEQAGRKKDAVASAASLGELPSRTKRGRQDQATRAAGLDASKAQIAANQQEAVRVSQMSANEAAKRAHDATAAAAAATQRAAEAAQRASGKPVAHPSTTPADQPRSVAGRRGRVRRDAGPVAPAADVPTPPPATGRRRAQPASTGPANARPGSPGSAAPGAQRAGAAKPGVPSPAPAPDDAPEARRSARGGARGKGGRPAPIPAPAGVGEPGEPTVGGAPPARPRPRPRPPAPGSTPASTTRRR